MQQSMRLSVNLLCLATVLWVPASVAWPVVGFQLGYQVASFLCPWLAKKDGAQ